MTHNSVTNFLLKSSALPKNTTAIIFSEVPVAVHHYCLPSLNHLLHWLPRLPVYFAFFSFSVSFFWFSRLLLPLQCWYERGSQPTAPHHQNSHGRCDTLQDVWNCWQGLIKKDRSLPLAQFRHWPGWADRLSSGLHHDRFEIFFFKAVAKEPLLRMVSVNFQHSNSIPDDLATIFGHFYFGSLFVIQCLEARKVSNFNTVVWYGVPRHAQSAAV